MTARHGHFFDDDKRGALEGLETRHLFEPHEPTALLVPPR
jgi:hypothetical protein